MLTSGEAPTMSKPLLQDADDEFEEEPAASAADLHMRQQTPEKRRAPRRHLTYDSNASVLASHTFELGHIFTYDRNVAPYDYRRDFPLVAFTCSILGSGWIGGLAGDEELEDDEGGTALNTVTAGYTSLADDANGAAGGGTATSDTTSRSCGTGLLGALRGHMKALVFGIISFAMLGVRLYSYSHAAVGHSLPLGQAMLALMGVSLSIIAAIQGPLALFVIARTIRNTVHRRSLLALLQSLRLHAPALYLAAVANARQVTKWTLIGLLLIVGTSVSAACLQEIQVFSGESTQLVAFDSIGHIVDLTTSVLSMCTLLLFALSCVLMRWLVRSEVVFIERAHAAARVRARSSTAASAAPSPAAMTLNDGVDDAGVLADDFLALHLRVRRIVRSAAEPGYPLLLSSFVSAFVVSVYLVLWVVVSLVSATGTPSSSTLSVYDRVVTYVLISLVVLALLIEYSLLLFGLTAVNNEQRRVEAGFERCGALPLIERSLLVRQVAMLPVYVEVGGLAITSSRLRTTLGAVLLAAIPVGFRLLAKFLSA